MEECMKQSGHTAYARAEERMNRRLAEHTEEQESKRQRVEAPQESPSPEHGATSERKTVDSQCEEEEGRVMHKEQANREHKRKADADHEDEPEHKSSALPFEAGTSSSSSAVPGYEVIVDQTEWSSVDYAKPDDEYIGECMRKWVSRKILVMHS